MSLHKGRKQIKGNNLVWKINSEVSCDKRNIIYIITCEKEKCQQTNKYNKNILVKVKGV